ncbi:unnamed protein product [Clonostachys rosea]|uniref:NADP-dependent oxidoreductase domain-containing protein n=1 Tax=Bionectria ochroleuca TaxID=29856 RepID=A0ABY6USH5_BIOOC|nr:unnamed protein product [Clonostachys rosea]
MGGHVVGTNEGSNMMDDVLIANLPIKLLRSALRTLISQGSVTQQPFVQHIRDYLTRSPPELTPPSALFPVPDDLSIECKQYLEITRCIFSSKLSEESLAYLTHFLSSIREGKAKWSEGSDLEAAFRTFGGDVVQAVQALKEAKPNLTETLKTKLLNLLTSSRDLKDYCQANNLPYLFARAERQVQDVFTFFFSEAPLATYSNQLLQINVAKTTSPNSLIEKFQLGPHEVPRLFNGFWQLSSPAWGSGTSDTQEAALIQLVESGLSAADMADHYGDAELIYGDFRQRLPLDIRNTIYAATKWCIFSAVKQTINREWVLAAVKERSRRLSGRVELLQFHWYDYSSKEYLNILEEMILVSKEYPELLSSVGLCNFDSEHVEEVCQHLLDKTGSVGIVSNQVQFSLFDSRPLHKMSAVCSKYGLKLLTYGSFSGGFISEKWLGVPAPEVYSEGQNLTPSQRKYLDIINLWGQWEEFQSLLGTLKAIANSRNVSLTNVATRWVLQQSAVGAVIVGTRLGVTAHSDDNVNVFTFRLSEDEMKEINRVALGPGNSKCLAMFERLGDCGNEYRAMH